MSGLGGKPLSAKVLIAEDEANIAELLQFLLTRAGYDVSCAADGEAALAAVRRDRPAVLVLDLMMPKLSGFEVLKAVRADEGLAGLPILMLTAKGQEKDRQLAQELGADAFITKPFSNVDVVARVNELVTGEV